MLEKRVVHRATRLYGSKTQADGWGLTPMVCPFCASATFLRGPYFEVHREHGYSLCPCSGHSLAEATALAATLQDDYLLPNEGSYEGER